MSEIRLFPGQVEAIEKLASGFILCGGVGSGKSITSLGYFFTKECDGILHPDGSIDIPKNKVLDLYIITTARKRDTHEWEDELDRWKMSTKPMLNEVGNLVTIDSWNNLGKHKDVKNSFFIFDEQRVVGSGSWAKSFVKIARQNRWILLSATPGDTWMDYINVFVANGFYKNRTQFLREHAIYSRFSKYPKVDKYIGVSKLEKYRRSITVNIDISKKTQKHYYTVTTEFDRELYKSILKDRWNPYKNEPIQGISEACSLLRRVSNDDPSRLKALMDILRVHNKVIVFYNFDYELDTLRGLSEQYPLAEWNGHKHEPIPKTDSWIFLVQYTAGAEGWNCIETDTIVFYSQNYSYKLMTQAAGRIDRMNTPFVDLNYYVFKSNSSIDISIARALKSKRNFNESRFLVSF